MCSTSGGSGTALGWGAAPTPKGVWVAFSVTGETFPFPSEVEALRKALTLPAGVVALVPWGESVAGAISGDI